MIPWQLPATCFLLMTIGSLTLQSVVPDLLAKHLLFWLISWLVFYITARTNFRSWKQLANPIFIIWFGLLFLVLVLPGTKSTARWFAFGPILAQPSQLSLPVIALFLSQNLKQNYLSQLSKLWTYLIAIGLALFMIMIEPDFGTTLVFLISIGLTIVMVGLANKVLLKLLVVILVGGIFSWFSLLKPYQKERITSFVRPEETSSASTYNTRQAIISVGSGGILGLGLGRGTQSQLKFLPEKHTDFVFASLAEETGLVGGGLVIALYTWLILSLSRQAERMDFDKKIMLVMTGIWLTVQTSINIGMNLGALPVTGLTLPLISYGGSSLISTMWLFGLVQSAINSLETNPRLHLS